MSQVVLVLGKFEGHNEVHASVQNACSYKMLLL